jgi:capsular exopolysaccharide synthesis family protein
MTNDQLDLNEILKPYKRHWKWFVLFVFLAVALALVYIRYATPEYSVQAKLQILQEQGAGSELSAFRDLQMLSGSGKTQVEDEIEILNSRSNFIEVVKELGLNVKIKALGRIHDTELYQDPPFRVNFLSADSAFHYAKGTAVVSILGENEFLLKEDDDTPSRKFSFGSTITTGFGEFILIPNMENAERYQDREFQISVSPVPDVAQFYKSKVQISITDELSNIISLGLNDPVPQKAIDILNALISTYNNNAIESKKVIADRTFSFINERIVDISGDLSSVDESEEEFKASRGITDVASQSNINLNLGATNRQELTNAEIQLNRLLATKDLIDNQVGYEPLPSNLGLTDNTIASTVASYNNLVTQREIMLRSSNERNPTVVNLDGQLNSLKQTLQVSLAGAIQSLTLQVNNLSGQLSRINAQIYSAPGRERALRDISRQKETIEALYLYLLQKREESQITFASASPKSKVIDQAYLASPFPVSPKKPLLLLAALILGVLAPFSFIYLNQLLDNKVHNKLGLEKIVGDIPVLAELPRLGRKENTLVKAGDRSVLAESLRILRTNLDYLIKARGFGGKGTVVFVTSSVPGEGKTFVSSNLAMIYAKAGKKVLLVGADIRNPKINQFYSGANVDTLKRASGAKANKGLTDYLVEPALTSREVTNSVLVGDQTVDIIYSGKLMPNPSELLMSDRLNALLEEVRDHYDYIVVDTAPLIVVSDTLLISKYADLILYVTRANTTETKVLEFPLKMHAEGKLKGLSFLVNGVKESNLGYGGKYGYGYGKTTRKWWQWTS